MTRTLTPEHLMGYQPYLLARAQYMRHPHLEDLVQDTIIDCWEERLGYEESEINLKTWLCRRLRAQYHLQIDLWRLS